MITFHSQLTVSFIFIGCPFVTMAFAFNTCTFWVIWKWQLSSSTTVRYIHLYDRTPSPVPATNIHYTYTLYYTGKTSGMFRWQTMTLRRRMGFKKELTSFFISLCSKIIKNAITQISTHGNPWNYVCELGLLDTISYWTMAKSHNSISCYIGPKSNVEFWA